MRPRPPTLYICWGLHRTPRPGHPCRDAYEALEAAGVTPEMVRCDDGGYSPPGSTAPADAAKPAGSPEGTGVPVLVTQDRQVIAGSNAIKACAQTVS